MPTGPGERVRVWSGAPIRRQDPFRPPGSRSPGSSRPRDDYSEYEASRSPPSPSRYPPQSHSAEPNHADVYNARQDPEPAAAAPAGSNTVAPTRRRDSSLPADPPVGVGHDAPSGALFVEETYHNGDRYSGFVVQDTERKGVLKKSGHGLYLFANGSYYEGEWKDGAMSGHGVFLDAVTGDRFEGHWDKGKRVMGSLYFKSGPQGVGARQYHGRFAEDGCAKHGRAVIWEGDEMFEALYDHDVLLLKTPFRTSPNLQFSAAAPRESSPNEAAREAAGATKTQPTSVATTRSKEGPVRGASSGGGQQSAATSGSTKDKAPASGSTASEEPPATKEPTDEELTAILLKAGGGMPLSELQLTAALKVLQRRRRQPSTTNRAYPTEAHELREQDERRKAIGGTLLLKQEDAKPGTTNRRELRDALRFYRY
jgi:hypothetical protein